jgi:hypothetical protein
VFESRRGGELVVVQDEERAAAAGASPLSQPVAAGGADVPGGAGEPTTGVLLDELLEAEQAARRADAAVVRLLARLVRHEVGAEVGDAGAALEAIEAVADEVTPLPGWTTGTAQRRVADAVWLTTALPRTCAAVAAGLLDLRRAAVITEGTVCAPRRTPGRWTRRCAGRGAPRRA